MVNPRDPSSEQPSDPSADTPPDVSSSNLPTESEANSAAETSEEDGLEEIVLEDSSEFDLESPEEILEMLGIVPPSNQASGPPSQNNLPVLQKLPFDLHRVAGLLIIFGTLGTILFVGLNQDVQEGESAFFEFPLVTEAPPTPDTEQPASTETPSLTTLLPRQEQPSNRDTLGLVGPRSKPTPFSNPPSAKATLQDPVGGTGAIAPAAKSVPPTDLPIKISDMPAEHWAYPFVVGLHQEGIIENFPDGKFNPDQPVTRAELAAQIQRAYKLAAEQKPLSFPDMPDNAGASGAIEHAVNTGFMSGYAEGDFRPDQPIPRYQVWVTLVSGLGIDPLANPDPNLQRFEDSSQLPNWAKGQVAAATESALVVKNPDSDRLDPLQPATRAEVATMVYQSLVKDGKVVAINSDYVVKP